MNFIFLILFCIFGYGTLVLGSLKWKNSILYTVAIGCVVNANIFNSVDYPISIGNLVFGMNSVIYVLFLFSILIMYIDFGKKNAITLIICSIGGIAFASIIQLLTNIASNGFQIKYVYDLIAYFASCISSFVAGLILIKLFDYFKQKKFNIYLNIGVNLIIASLVDSIIYYIITLSIKISVLSLEFWLSLLSLYLGKLISIFFALISLIFLKKYCKVDKQLNDNENT